jgi:hypothetical protein
MTAIRRLTPATGLGAITGFHAFTVDADGNLLYSFAADGDQNIQTQDQLNAYVMYEAATSDYRYAINDEGELVISFTTAS